LFPIRPQFTFKALRQEECKMFDSKKCPFALSCIPEKNYKGESYKVMFKYGDDLKQDNLILQMLRVFDKLWRENGLDLKMNVYRTLSTGNELGFIEIVDAENNHKIHKDFSKGFVDSFDDRSTLMFLENYNSNDKRDLSIARENYLRSSAAYLVATYILGIGDRHSGNVMVQRNGKFFHIDFGHILGNFKMKLGMKRCNYVLL
jgi:phosphatidylinositol kinase/protein kinase (PI-3  family)